MPSLLVPKPEAVAHATAPDVRYIARNPGDIALAGQLGLFLATRVTLRVSTAQGSTKPFARLDVAGARGKTAGAIGPGTGVPGGSDAW